MVMIQRYYIAAIFLSILRATISFNPLKQQRNDIILENFIEKHMQQPLTIVFKDELSDDYIIKAPFSKILLNSEEKNVHYSKEYHSSQWGSYILIEKNIITLQQSITCLVRFKHAQKRQKYLIIFENDVTDEDMTNAFSLLWKQFIHNVVIYTHNRTFFTWFPYDIKNNCGKNVNAVKINDNYFQNKIPAKLNGCSIKVSWNPMTIFMHNPFNNTYPGAMFLFLDEIAGRIGVRVEYLTENPDFFTSYLNTGAYNLTDEYLQKTGIDMILYSTRTGDYFDLDKCVSITRGYIYFVLPPRKPSTYSNYVVNLFDSISLLFLTLSIGTALVLWNYFTKKSVLDSAFKIFQLVVQNNTKEHFFNNFPRRMFLISFLAFMICVNTIYFTYMSSILTKPALTKRIESIDELFRSNMPITAYNSTYRTFHSQYGMKGNWRMFKQSNILELIEEFAGNDSFAIVLNNFHFNYFKNPGHLEILKRDPISPIDYLASTRKGFPLLEKIDLWITRMYETGLLGKYISESSVPLKKFVVEFTDTSKIKLGMEHLRGAFYIIAAGLLSSVVVFMIEIMYSSSFIHCHS